MLRVVPLSAVTLVIYLVSSVLTGGHPLALPGDVGVPPWDWPLLSVTLVSGVNWTATGADGLIAAALVLLFLAVVRVANMAASGGMAPSILAVLSFALYVVAFLVLPAAATSTFFILMLIALVEALSVTVISATRAPR